MGLDYLSEEFNCNILHENKIDNVPYRLFISNILNCEPFRATEIAEVLRLFRVISIRVEN